MATLSFWGGVGTVTGSKYLIETDRARVLVDCGMFQGLKELRERNWREPPFDARSVNAVLITHAHIDHTGYLPRLVSHGFHGPIFCSRGTADLLKILLPDAARLQEEEASYRNRHKLTKHSPAKPLYTEADAKRTLELIQPVANNGAPVSVAKGVEAEFRIAGHILGSSLVLVNLAEAGEDKKQEGRAAGRELDLPSLAGQVLARARRVGDARHGRARRQLHPFDLEPGDGLGQQLADRHHPARPAGQRRRAVEPADPPGRLDQLLDADGERARHLDQHGQGRVGRP